MFVDIDIGPFTVFWLILIIGGKMLFERRSLLFSIYI